jgi:hypothetical protein
VWKKSGATEAAEQLRESLSTVVSVELITLFIEFLGLQNELVPRRYAFTFPAIPILNTREYPVMLSDMFMVLTSSFWGPFSLWAATSIFIPLVFSYFFNLTLKTKTKHTTSRSQSHESYRADPLTFNIVKALVSWLVYSEGATLGGSISKESVDRINSSVPGGYRGILIGSAIGAVTSIYEAALRK